MHGVPSISALVGDTELGQKNGMAVPVLQAAHYTEKLGEWCCVACSV